MALFIDPDARVRKRRKGAAILKKPATVVPIPVVAHPVPLHVPPQILAVLKESLYLRRSSFELWPLLPHVRHAMSHPPLSKHSHIAKFLSWIATNPSHRVSSAVSVAEKFELHRLVFHNSVQALANAMIHTDRIARTILETILVSNLEAAQLICYVDFESSDETRWTLGALC
jgi:hypothetical protein